MDPPASQAPDAVANADDTAALDAIARMRWRIRVLRAARAGLELTLYGLAFAVLVVLGAKLGRFSDHAARILLWSSAAFPVLGITVGLVRRVSPLMAAQLLDKAY